MYIRTIIDDKEVIKFLEELGYTVTTIRMVLKNEFGFKDTKEMIKKLNVSEALLRFRVALKDKQEYNDLITKLSPLLEIFADPNRKDRGVWSYKLDSYYLGGIVDTAGNYEHVGRTQKTVVTYHIDEVFKDLLKERIIKSTNIKGVQILW